MAAKSKRPATYDLKKQDRRRNVFVQVGLVAVVALFAAGLLTYIVTSSDKPEVGDGGRPVRVAAAEVITADGGTEPKAVVSVYEDFLCPACGNFERTMGPTLNRLVDNGVIAVDYYFVSILDRAGEGYSSRAGGAAYCVADESNDAFRRFHAALYTPEIQPQERGGVYPNDARLTEIARIAGAGGGVPDCIDSGRYVDVVKGNAGASEVNSTPTVRLNGEEVTPAELVTKVREVVGDVPGIDAPAPAAS